MRIQMLPPFINTLGAYVCAYAEKSKARKPLILRAFWLCLRPESNPGQNLEKPVFMRVSAHKASLRNSIFAWFYVYNVIARCTCSIFSSWLLLEK